jgi:hypothetical protein
MTSESRPDETAAHTGTPSIVAYRLGHDPEARLTAASVTREWILNTHGRFAQRCLPLLIANQSGWTLHNPVPFRVTWDGSDGQLGLKIEGLDAGAPAHVSSLFGYGILSWTIPYLFRTSAGYNLLARGPANLPKDGISALEGVVETDWAVASFTMNWKFTRPDVAVTFERDEPFCMLVPQRRGEIESFRATSRPLSSNAELEAHHRAWDESRKLSILLKRAAVALKGPEHPDALKWEGHYFRGTSPGGATAPEHQTKLNVPEFESG